jgi:hypothetical protein
VTAEQILEAYRSAGHIVTSELRCCRSRLRRTIASWSSRFSTMRFVNAARCGIGRSRLGIQYFLGAGIQPTIDFLRASEDAHAADILKYVEESVRSPYFDGVEGFDKDRLRYFRRN